MIKRGQNSSPK